MEFSQPSCVCPVHCPGEGLQERQEAALEKRFWILDRGHHVQSFAELGESFEYVREHRDCSLVQMLQPGRSGPAEHEPPASLTADDLPLPNPAADRFWHENYAAIEAVTELLPVDVNLLQAPGATSLGGEGFRPQTDDECRLALLDIGPRPFDLTGDIPQQVAGILEDLSLRLLQSAIWIRNPEAAQADTSSAELAAVS